MKWRLEKVEFERQRFQPIESMSVTFQFVTPSVGAAYSAPDGAVGFIDLDFYKYAGPDGPFGSGAHAGDGGAPVAVLVVAAEGAGLEGVGRSRSQAGHGHVAGVPTRSTRNSSRTPELSRVLSLPPAAAGDSRAPKNRCSVEPAAVGAASGWARHFRLHQISSGQAVRAGGSATS